MRHLGVPSLCSCLLIAVVTGGCATILHGTGQEIPVSSDPSGAQVSVDGMPMCKTPCSPNLKRKHDHILTLKKDGYKQEDVTIMHVLSGAVAGNILAGGLIGWGVDAASGAQYRLVPKTLHVDLTPAEEGAGGAETGTGGPTAEQRLENLAQIHQAGALTDSEYAALKKVVMGEVTAGTDSNSSLAPDVRVERLYEMREKNLITSGEFDAMKHEIVKPLEASRKQVPVTP